MQDQTHFFIDADVVIENYNHKNPELRKMTKTSLAEQLGVTPQTLSDWKKRHVKLIQTLVQMAEIGGCSIEDFIKKHQ
jgi:DNA-binding Xre family transcriptional regulator